MYLDIIFICNPFLVIVILELDAWDVGKCEKEDHDGCIMWLMDALIDIGRGLYGINIF